MQPGLLEGERRLIGEEPEAPAILFGERTDARAALLVADDQQPTPRFPPTSIGTIRR